MKIEKHHTSGPWEVYHGSFGVYIVPQGKTVLDDHTIARVTHRNKQGNAHLIAAAPELLMSILEALEALELNKSQIKPGAYSYLHLILETALARVTG